MKTEFLTKDDFLKYWQSQRALTRKTIVAFPENDLFNFTIGGMRPYAEMIAELTAIAVPALLSFTSNTIEPFDNIQKYASKEEILKQWDNDTNKINELFNILTEERMQENFVLFKMFDYKIAQHLFYFVDNEIHHRGQSYVYLRALEIEPPLFYETL